MFYKTGIDITNDKQMFNFIKEHFEYSIMNSWNRVNTIANNVKLYNLDLSGDWTIAYDLLNNGEYDNISFMIQEWELEHPGYSVYFNGRSGGYLVLKPSDENRSVLCDDIIESEDYEEYKRFCREFYGSVKANRDDLVYYTKLIQDFDKFCDDLRDYCNELSNLKFEVVEMQRAVDNFNEEYAEDLKYLRFNYLICNSNGEVNINEISILKSLLAAFYKVADRSDSGYTIVSLGNGMVKLKRKGF